MASLLVSCVNKSDRPDPDQRIDYLGGTHNNHPWKHSLSDAIFHIEMNIHSYHLHVNGLDEPLKITSNNGNKYLRIQSDSFYPLGLLALPECPH